MTPIKKLLVGGKIRLWSSIGVGTLSASSAPIIWANYEKLNKVKDMDFIKNMKEQIKKVVDIKKVSEKLSEQYTTQKEKIKNWKEQQLKEAWKNKENSAKNVYKIATETANSANYYLWELKPIVNAFVGWIPNIIQDTIAYDEKSNASFLNIQKIHSIFTNANAPQAFQELVKTTQKHIETISQINNSDTNQLFNKLRNIKNHEISGFLSSIKDNASKLDSKYEKHCSKKLIYHLFLGKNYEENRNTNIKNLKTKENLVSTIVQQRLPQYKSAVEQQITRLNTQATDDKTNKEVESCGNPPSSPT